MITLTAVIYAVITLIVAGLIFWLLLWFIDFAKIPEPFNRVAKVVLAAFAVIAVIGVLLSLLGGPQIIRW